jgi:hypothetical protein
LINFSTNDDKLENIMKNVININRTFAIILLLLAACDQEVITTEPAQPDSTNLPPYPCGGTSGSANFTKFVAVGNSLVAGVQAGALFTDGQNNSLPLIINNQLACAGGTQTFVQPDIKASLGWNLFVTQPFLTDNTKPILGRLLLQYGTGKDCKTGAPSPKPTPQAYAPGNLEALPNPAANPNFIWGNGSTKPTLNNFGVPAIVLGQALIPQTGAWAGAGSDPRFSPFYGRLAVPGTGTSTIIGDAAAAQGTFFMFWLGLDDFFLHAAFGADPTKAPLTSNGAFAGQYNAAIGALLGSNPNLKGVVGNFPNIFAMPHFTSVTYNPVPLDVATSGALNTGFAGYNAVIDALIANKALFGISDAIATELGTRKVAFVAGCENKVVLTDETLTDIGPYLDAMQGAGLLSAGDRAKLVPYEQIRQSTINDVLPLSTGSVLGTPGTFGIWGLSEPLTDQYVIVPAEKEAINAARTSFNAAVAAAVSGSGDRLALADVDAAFNAFVNAKGAIYDNVFITPNINPPTGIYSEDGVHPNSRGYAFLANVFISAINTKFGATVPLVNLSRYGATGLPIP